MVDISAEELSKVVNGRLEGDPSIKVHKLSEIEQGTPGSVAFLADEKYISYFHDCSASIIILNNSFQELKPNNSQTLIWVEDARACFASLLKYYAELKQMDKRGIHQSVIMDSSSTVKDDVYIGANVFIGENSVIGLGAKVYPGCYIGANVTIGDGTILYPGVKVYDDSKIGAHCTFHSGVVLGGDGFGFTPNQENHYHKVYHIGNVIIEDHVEIGSNTTVDKATVGSTIIRKGVKLDNLIQIAHNVEIGENTVIAAQTGIAGSTKIGANCMIGGQVGIVGHIEIADEVKIAAQSGISQSITKKGQIVQGSPAFNILDYKKSYVLFKNLPHLKKTLDKLDSSKRD